MSDGTGGRWLAAVGGAIALIAVAAGKACLHAGGLADNAATALARSGDETVVASEVAARSADTVDMDAYYGRLGGQTDKTGGGEWKEVGKELGKTASEECLQDLAEENLGPARPGQDDSVCGLPPTR